MPEIHARLRLRRVAHRAGVADGAVQERAVDALVDGASTCRSAGPCPLRRSSRATHSLCPADARRTPAAAPGRSSTGTRLVLAAGRAVLEMLLDVGVFDRAVAPEALPEVEAEHEREQRRDRQRQSRMRTQRRRYRSASQPVLAGWGHQRVRSCRSPRSCVGLQARSQILVAASEHLGGIGRYGPFPRAASRRPRPATRRLPDPAPSESTDSHRATRVAAAWVPCRAPPAAFATAPGARRFAARTAPGLRSRAARRPRENSAGTAPASDDRRRNGSAAQPLAQALAAGTRRPFVELATPPEPGPRSMWRERRARARPSYGRD